MMKAFAEAELLVVPQYQLKWWFVDFAIPDRKLVIECDGAYWHNLPKQVINDKRKDVWLANHGWRIIRLGEHEIKTDAAGCALQVIEHLNQQAALQALAP